MATGIRTKKCFFTSALALKLQEDSDAQAKAEGEIVGLDFDPFLDSQDPGRYYKVGKIVEKSGNYWVDIHKVSSGKMSEKPGVIAEVAQNNGQWEFTDFHYQSGHDLLSILNALKKDREKPAPQGK